MSIKKFQVVVFAVNRPLIRRAGLAACALLLESSVQAGPPFVTDDPEPVKYGHWEVNYGASKIWRVGSASAALPVIDINYGIASDVQLHLQPRYSLEKDAQGQRAAVDDTEVGAKYRFLNREQDDMSFMAGIYPMLQLPTGDGRLGAGRGRLQALLPVWFQAGIANWTVYGGLGYRVNQGPQNKNSIFTGVTTLHQFRPWLQLGGEIFRETANARDSVSTSGFNLGGYCSLAPNYNLLFSAGKNLKNVPAASQRAVFIALQVLN